MNVVNLYDPLHEEGSEEVYGVDEEAASLLGAKLFSSEGM